jgi:hypothetical protein
VIIECPFCKTRLIRIGEELPYENRRVFLDSRIVAYCPCGYVIKIMENTNDNTPTLTY